LFERHAPYCQLTIQPPKEARRIRNILKINPN